MPPNNAEKEFVDYLLDLMQPIGPVTARRMFGGHGIFLDGLMFALVVDSTLYLKTDGDNRAEFTNRGLAAFTYQKKGGTARMSYHQAPEEALEEIDAMKLWANSAYAAAVRAAAKKPGGGRRS